MARRPLPLEEAARVTPRAASTTLIVRDAPRGLEVLMVRRSLQASFMPGAYVFPGGAVDDADGDCQTDEPRAALDRRIGAVTGVGDRACAYAVAALRECFEECGLWLGVAGSPALAPLRARLHGGAALAAIARDAGLPLATSALAPWSRWCTPFGSPKRFDTIFFIARAPQGQSPEVDAGETITLEWVYAPAALEAHRAGRFPMEFATIRNMEALAEHAQGTAALFGHIAGVERLSCITPRYKLDAGGSVIGVALPDEPEYATGYRAP